MSIMPLETIHVEKQGAEFFLAICQARDHSFVIAGVRDKNNKTHTLNITGKIFLENKQKSDKFRFLYPGIKSGLGDEYTSFWSTRDGFTSVRYKCFAVTYQQYLEYIKIVSAYNSNINFYQDSQDTELDNYIFKQQAALHNTEKKLSAAPPEYVSLFNSCRDTAVEIIEQTVAQKFIGRLLSLFFIELPCCGYLRNGQLSAATRLFILPAPPSIQLKLEDKKSYQTLKHIYICMEQIIDTPSNDERADYAKFAMLKELYLKLKPEAKVHIPLSDHLAIISKWRSDNITLINEYRMTSCLSSLREWMGCKTNTRVTIDNLLQSYSKVKLQPGK